MTPARPVSYDVQIRTLLGLLGEPFYRFSREESRITVLEWYCGCSACCPEDSPTCSVQWCELHGAQMKHLRLA